MVNPLPGSSWRVWEAGGGTGMGIPCGGQGLPPTPHLPFAAGRDVLDSVQSHQEENPSPRIVPEG